MTLISSNAGLRGPADELTTEVLEPAVAGFATLVRGEAVAIARDDRDTGSELVEEVTDLARSWGMDVVDLGVAATPAAKVFALRRGLGGAIVVTASHLEPDKNGLKFVAGAGMRPVDMRELPAPAAPPFARGSLARDEGAAAAHVEAICAAVDEAEIRASGLGLAYAGGAGESAARLVERLGSGGAADMTFCLDADGDRVELLDEHGSALDSELSLALAVVARDARRIVKGADTSRAIEALAAQRGAEVRVVTPGELHLFDALREHDGDLAGEGNGGVIVPAAGPGRDGLATGAAIAGLVARSGRPLSELAAEIPAFSLRRSSVPWDPGAGSAAIEELARRVGAEGVGRWGGVEVEDGEAWGLVRLSATEPVIRITAEAPDQAAADALHDRLAAALA